MGIPNGSRGKRGKKPGVKDAPDFIFAAEFRPELPVGAAFREDLIENYISLETEIVAHEDQPVRFISGTKDLNVADEDG
jgi:hypothetical protein